MAQQSVDKPPPTILWRYWPAINGGVMIAIIALAVAASLGRSARLPFASQMQIAALAGMALALLFGAVGEVLERLHLVPKTPDAPSDEFDATRPLAESIPIVEAAGADNGPRTQGELEQALSSPTTASTRLEGEPIPSKFVKSGVAAVWRVEHSANDPMKKDAV